MALEDILINIFQHAHNLTKERRFIFTGGVAMNSVALKKLAECSFIDEIIVPPSPGDSGAAIGAAFFGLIKSDTDTDNLKLNKGNLKENLFDSPSCAKTLHPSKSAFSNIIAFGINWVSEITAY